MTRHVGPASLPIAVPAAANQEGDGIVVGHGPATVEAYIDYQCPFCRQFELSAGPTLNELIAGRLINMVYHPMDFLDAVSTTRYSTRAAASAAAASDAGRFLDYSHALFVNQPPEGGPGLSNEELIEIGLSMGITSPAFAQSVLNGTYLAWPPYVTERAVQRGVAGTPSVFVEGVPVPARPGTIAAAVNAIGGPSQRL